MKAATSATPTIPSDKFLFSIPFAAFTVGVSTSDNTFKEVAVQMNDSEKQVEIQEFDFWSVMENSILHRLRPGQIVTGRVIQITAEEVYVEITYKADGIIKKSDLISQEVNIDDELELEVVKLNDGEGNVVLRQRA
jgi:4-hydroxy-3-methylbut-2-enyl diphosphate reductase